MNIAIIKTMRRQTADFEKGRARIQQTADPIARQLFTPCDMAGAGTLRPALSGNPSLVLQIVDQTLPGLPVGFGLLGLCVEHGCQNGHKIHSLASGSLQKEAVFLACDQLQNASGTGTRQRCIIQKIECFQCLQSKV